jgi:hypothetical protein
MVKGYPREADLERLDRMADDIASRHEGLDPV